MVKRRCVECLYFAAASDTEEQGCPDCGPSNALVPIGGTTSPISGGSSKGCVGMTTGGHRLCTRQCMLLSTFVRSNRRVRSTRRWRIWARPSGSAAAALGRRRSQRYAARRRRQSMKAWVLAWTRSSA
jgi:hypothetical protein